MLRRVQQVSEQAETSGQPEESPKQPILLGLRVILICSLLLFLLATLTEFYNSPDKNSVEPNSTHSTFADTLIVPGTRIGPVTLGLSPKLLESSLGHPRLRPHEAGVMHLFEDHGLVVYEENDKVMSVTARSPVFQTRSGIGVESSVDDLIKEMGKDYEMEGEGEVYTLHSWSRGWHAGIKGDKVVYFQVTPGLSEHPTAPNP